jgi:hypothetical protein
MTEVGHHETGGGPMIGRKKKLYAEGVQTQSELIVR